MRGLDVDLNGHTTLVVGGSRGMGGSVVLKAAAATVDLGRWRPNLLRLKLAATTRFSTLDAGRAARIMPEISRTGGARNAS